MVHAAPRWQRGKIARAIAAKAVIAARVDVYSEVPGLNSTLLEKMNIRIGEIGEKFPEPTEPNRQHSQGRYERRYPERGKSQAGQSRDAKGAGRPEWARKRAVESESAQYKNPGKRQERYRYDKHNDDNRNNNDNDNSMTGITRITTGATATMTMAGATGMTGITRITTGATATMTMAGATGMTGITRITTGATATMTMAGATGMTGITRITTGATATMTMAGATA